MISAQLPPSWHTVEKSASLSKGQQFILKVELNNFLGTDEGKNAIHFSTWKFPLIRAIFQLWLKAREGQA